MGTKAYLKVEGCNLIIGMTHDGSPNNLLWISKELIKLAIQKKCLTRFRKGDTATISALVTEFVKNHENWLFLDFPNNPEWVSFSAVLRPRWPGVIYAVVMNYEGDFRDNRTHFRLATFRREAF